MDTKETQQKTGEKKTKGRTFRGTVVAAKMQDTATVAVERYVQHPKYKKFMRRTKKYLVHNPAGAAKVGDAVTIAEVRPISRRKHFIII
ncbi:30S ribosomal protein S17 [Candidatus Kaiserbacteria bacterium]|nr:30S ribosomal protein S17 [Candidatus Kaiserbacteria bacterium]